MSKKKIERCLGVVIIALLITATAINTPISNEEIEYVEISEGVSAGVSTQLYDFEIPDTVIVEDEEKDLVESPLASETETETEEESEEVVEEEHSIMYPNCYVMNIRNTPSADSDDSIIATAKYDEEVEIVGEPNEEGWVKVDLGDTTGYCFYELLTDEMIEVEESATYTYNGTKLTKGLGTVQGPSGKETYYNLNMSNCVARMHSKGYSGDYWVRSDGVKMFGSYVMVAADFSIRPLGTLVPTSLGMGIVVDTGDFIYTNPYQLDICVTW